MAKPARSADSPKVIHQDLHPGRQETACGAVATLEDLHSWLVDELGQRAGAGSGRAAEHVAVFRVPPCATALAVPSDVLVVASPVPAATSKSAAGAGDGAEATACGATELARDEPYAGVGSTVAGVGVDVDQDGAVPAAAGVAVDEVFPVVPVQPFVFRALAEIAPVAATQVLAVGGLVVQQVAFPLRFLAVFGHPSE